MKRRGRPENEMATIGGEYSLPGNRPATHLQRGALLVSRGAVYVPYGGNYGDCGQYRGSIVGLPTTGSAPVTSFVVPTSLIS